MPAPSDKPDPLLSSREAELLDAATDVPLRYEPVSRKPLSNAWYWRVIDRIGLAALWLACGLLVVIVAVTTFGGSGWDWVSYLFLPVLLLLGIYLAAYLRANRRDSQLKATLKQAEYERRRAEVARMVIEQARREKKD